MKKLFWFLFTLPLMLLPTELFVLFWIILKPITFWQRLISIILGITFLGTIQSFLLLAWLVFLNEYFSYLDEENRKKRYTKMQQVESRIEKWL